jgi:hypothetical protein
MLSPGSNGRSSFYHPTASYFDITPVNLPVNVCAA